LKYADDKIFAELIRCISKDTLTEEDYTYIDDYEEFTAEVKRYENVIFQEGREEGMGLGEEKRKRSCIRIFRHRRKPRKHRQSTKNTP